MARNTRIFSDIDLNFLAHPVSGDVSRRTDVDAIKASVRNLVLTNNFERPFHSEIGSQIQSLLFEQATPLLPILIEKAIEQTITNFEPRVILTDVSAQLSADTNSIHVSIEFSILNIATIQTVNLILIRTR